MEAKPPRVLITPLYQTAAKNPSPPFPPCHPRLCISTKKKKKKKRLSAEAPHLFKLQVGWFLKFYETNVCSVALLLYAHTAATLGNVPVGQQTLTTVVFRQYWCSKTLYFAFEAVRLLSGSKMTHELIIVHVPNIPVGSVQGWFTNCVFMFFISFSPLSSYFKLLFQRAA